MSLGCYFGNQGFFYSDAHGFEVLSLLFSDCKDTHFQRVIHSQVESVVTK